MRKKLLAVGILFAVGLGLASAGQREEADVARGRGALLYQIHCATCHGLEGRGDGPLAEDLKVRPRDLTDLVETRDSGEIVFPAARLKAVIDGRNAVRGHGSREMPVWGITFQDPSRDTDQEDAVDRRLFALLDFLKSIQAADTKLDEQETGD